MTVKKFTSNKKHLIFLGFEIFAIGFALFILINFKIFTVKEITHYNVISSLLILLGLITFITGLRKRTFVFSQNSISFFNNKSLKFESDFSKIYHVRLFSPENNRQFTLGIVKETENTKKDASPNDIDENKEILQISSAFFEPKTLLNVAKELHALALKHEFLFDDELDIINSPSSNKNLNK
ncbi:MAG: hypothetical protein A2X64_08175 [Ignavibacteria bacterium GWF2_33_9]|nr:MAG: hypothetical protein A2X64_08175 [Ignavibacteria bacterium GWF2_33_9]